MASLAVLEMPVPVTEPKKEKKSKRRGRRGGGSVWKPTYKVTLPNGRVERRETATYWIAYRDEAGERVTKNSGFTTKEGAHKMLEDCRRAVSTGERTELEQYKNVTLHQLAEDLKAQYRTKGRRSTGKLELSLKRLEEHFGENFCVYYLTSDKIEKYREARRADESKPSEPTIARELAALKAALRLGHKNDRVKKVPHIEMPDERDRAEEGEFSPEQMAKLLARLESKNRTAPLAPLVRFLYRTGMRAEEPIGLRWSEVRLDLKTLRLPGRRTKNLAAKPITLDGDVLKLVQAQREICDRKFPGCEFVFPDGNGEAMPYDRALDQFQAACKAEGIAEGFQTWDGKTRKPGFHDLRRTFAREADRCGVPHSEIMRIAGWKTYAMLLRYLGANEDRMRSAFAKMDAGYGKVKEQANG